MGVIADNLASLKSRIASAISQYQRNPDTVNLLAVSKTQPISAIKEAFSAGQTDFGENYLQEALSKMSELKNWPIEWHFIGPIQSNKTRDIAEHFSWVHSVDRIKIAERLSSQRPRHLPPLNIFLQLNLDQEPSKSGFAQSELLEAARYISTLPHIKLRGLMLIPAPRDSLKEQQEIFRKLYHIQKELIEKGLSLDQTSMGMSNDIEAAIAEGSNWLRVGTGIFGSRKENE
ncbi:MAG: alanine racemase protein [Gammaproteobacteria bacterium]|jgi:pyridoxal phosphate enzyme (YggS family)|nr:alanine racemase protein [Gammaproteobacteria bacterium]